MLDFSFNSFSYISLDIVVIFLLLQLCVLFVIVNVFLWYFIE